MTPNSVIDEIERLYKVTLRFHRAKLCAIQQKWFLLLAVITLGLLWQVYLRDSDKPSIDSKVGKKVNT